MNGYFQLKYAGHSYSIVRSRLIKSYVSTYSVNETVAIWVVNIFSNLLGYSDLQNADDLYDTGDEKHEPVITELPAVAAELKQPQIITQEPPLSQNSPRSEPQNQVNSILKVSDEKTKKKPKSTHVSVNDSTQPGQKSQTSQTNKATQKKQNGQAHKQLQQRIAADTHSVAVMADGAVYATGLNDDGQCNVHGWRNMRAVAAGAFFTVGLREDGRVIACGRNEYGQCNVRGWRDIVAISAGARHTIGLKADGTLVSTGQNRNGECNIENWRNVIQISAGYLCTFGIKKDNKVLVKGNVKKANLTVSHLSNVKDIVNPAPFKAIALKRDGRIQRVGKENAMGRTFGKWHDIEQISAGPDYFAGLKTDGTVVLLAYFWVDSGIECNTNDWKDIVAIAAGRFHLLGVKKDGSVISAMMHPNVAVDRGQCKVGTWKVF